MTQINARIAKLWPAWTLPNGQLAKLWTAWFLFTFGWGFYHGYMGIPMNDWISWVLQGGSLALTIWVVGRLWRIGP